jgi:N utilization substance protein B
MKGQPFDQVLAALVAPPEPYAAELVKAAARRHEEVDRLVAAQADGWRLERMPVIDRQVLRLATVELLEFADVPTAVVLDEAVELAKAYSTEDSSRFVNGVLAALAARIRPVGASR